MNARTTLGACLVLAAILAGATFLDRAQRLVPVHAAARDLPAGTALDRGDLVVVQVRLRQVACRSPLPTRRRSAAGLRRRPQRVRRPWRTRSSRARSGRSPAWAGR
jgi:hypothetical protein